MTSKFTEFANKEIVNVKNGIKIGYADDIVFDIKTAKATAIIVYGRGRFFGLFGRDEDMIIEWEHIEMIGEDTILVNREGIFYERKTVDKKSYKYNFFEKLFN